MIITFVVLQKFIFITHMVDQKTAIFYRTKALTVFDIRDGEDKSQIHQQDTR